MLDSLALVAPVHLVTYIPILYIYEGTRLLCVTLSHKRITSLGKKSQYLVLFGNTINTEPGLLPNPFFRDLLKKQAEQEIGVGG
jgi:hypothetical protein